MRIYAIWIETIMNGRTFTRSYENELMAKISRIICYGNECFWWLQLFQSYINLLNIWEESHNEHLHHSFIVLLYVCNILKCIPRVRQQHVSEKVIALWCNLFLGSFGWFLFDPKQEKQLEKIKFSLQLLNHSWNIKEIF